MGPEMMIIPAAGRPLDHVLEQEEVHRSRDAPLEDFSIQQRGTNVISLAVFEVGLPRQVAFRDGVDVEDRADCAASGRGLPPIGVLVLEDLTALFGELLAALARLQVA